jgi:hypothetical protein
MAIGYNPKIVTSGLVAYLDAGNPRKFSPNVHPNSKDIGSWFIARKGNNLGNNCSISLDSTAGPSPAGGIPMKMVASNTDPHIASWNSSSYNLARANNGETWTVSVYAKANTATTCELYVFGANESGSGFVSGNFLTIKQQNISVTTDWQRFQTQITMANTNIAFIQARLDGTTGTPTAGANTYWFDGWQVECANTASRFNDNFNSNGSNWLDTTGQNNFTLYKKPKFSSNTNEGFLSFSANTFQYADGSNLGNLTNWTAEAWVRITNPLTNKVTTIVTNVYDGVSKLNFSIGTNNSPTNYNLTVGFFDGSWRNVTGITPTQNTWFHVVGTYDGSTLKMFSNGIQVDSLSYVGTPQSGGSVRVGRRWDGVDNVATNFLDADIGIIRIYNRALSNTEIQQNFSASRGRFGI